MGCLLLLIPILLLAWPVVEIALIVYLAQNVGLLGTIGVLVGGAVAGTALMRWQGWETWRRIDAELKQGTLPADALLDGLLIFAAGVLLFLPGLLSDLVAMAILIPWTRALLKLGLAAWFRGHVVMHSVTGSRTDDGVIDSHVVSRETDDPPDLPRLNPPRDP